MKWRSLLFVAADDQKRVDKAGTRGADAVILDLEDAVTPERKPVAREQLASAVARISATGTPVVVRINAGWWNAVMDLEFAVIEGVAAIMVPKVEDAGRLDVLSTMLQERAVGTGLAVSPDLIALIESPAALVSLDEIAGVKGLVGLALGTEDFSLMLGVPPSVEALDLPCRQVALTASAHGLMALGVPGSISNIADTDSWNKAVQLGRAVGMTGALCIHPSQIEPANRGFSISQAEQMWSVRVVDSWEEAGRPGAFKLDGKMIDLPVVLAAQRALGIAGDP